MKRHVTFELEAADLEAMIEGVPIDLEADDADSVTLKTGAWPTIDGESQTIRFEEPEYDLTDEQIDGGEA